MFDEQRAHELEEAAQLAQELGDVDAELAAREAMEQMRAELSQKLQGGAQPQPNDVPEIPPPASPEEFKARQSAANEPGLIEKVKGYIPNPIGMLDATATLATGATTGLFGQAAGFLHGTGSALQRGDFGAQEGADKIAEEQASTGENLTWSPKTESGQRYIEKIGDFAPTMAAMGGLGNELGVIANSAKAAAPIAEGVVAPALKSVNNAIKNEVNLLKPTPSQKKLDIINKLKNGDTDNSLAELDLKVVDPKLKNASGELLPEAYAVVVDVVAKETIKQGFDSGLVQAVKTADDHNASKMLDMLNISQKGKKNTVYGNENRPTDVIGDSLAQNIRFAKNVNKKAGEEVNAAARALKNEVVDVSEPVNSFISNLSDKVGINIVRDGNGKIKADYRGSDIEGKMYAPEQKLINNIIERMADTETPKAYDVHRLKRAIDQTVTYGKSNSKSLWPDIERSVKSLRNNLDSTLDSNFESYNKANTKYSDTIKVLDDFQNTAGSKIDLFGEGADKQLGTLSRKLLSNVQSRQELSNAIKNLHNVNEKYGNKIKDDPMALITFANELDNMFGPAAKSSLAGEQSIGTKSALREVAWSRSLTDVAIKGTQAAADKLRGVNQEAAYKSMRELLARQKTRKAEASQ